MTRCDVDLVKAAKLWDLSFSQCQNALIAKPQLYIWSFAMFSAVVQALISEQQSVKRFFKQKTALFHYMFKTCKNK